MEMEETPRSHWRCGDMKWAPGTAAGWTTGRDWLIARVETRID